MPSSLVRQVCASPTQPPRNILKKGKWCGAAAPPFAIASGAPLRFAGCHIPCAHKPCVTPRLCSEFTTSLRFGRALSTAAPPRSRHLPAAGSLLDLYRLRSAPAEVKEPGVSAETGFVPQPPFCSAARPHSGWWRTVSLPSLRSFVPHSASLNPGLPASFNYNQ